MELEFSNEGLERQKTLIGDFIIQFEHLNDWMRFTIPRIIYGVFPTELKMRNIETLLTDLGAESLKSKFDSLLVDNFQDHPKLIDLNNKLSTKFSSLCNIRNTIAHGTYRLGWKNFNAGMNDESFSIRHSKATKKGYQKRSKIISVAELESLIISVRSLYPCYSHINTYIRCIQKKERNELKERYIKELERLVSSIDKIKFEHLNILN